MPFTAKQQDWLKQVYISSGVPSDVIDNVIQTNTMGYLSMSVGFIPCKLPLPDIDDIIICSIIGHVSNTGRKDIFCELLSEHKKMMGPDMPVFSLDTKSDALVLMRSVSPSKVAPEEVKVILDKLEKDCIKWREKLTAVVNKPIDPKHGRGRLTQLLAK